MNLIILSLGRIADTQCVVTTQNRLRILMRYSSIALNDAAGWGKRRTSHATGTIIHTFSLMENRLYFVVGGIAAVIVVNAQYLQKCSAVASNCTMHFWLCTHSNDFSMNIVFLLTLRLFTLVVQDFWKSAHTFQFDDFANQLEYQAGKFVDTFWHWKNGENMRITFRKSSSCMEISTASCSKWWFLRKNFHSGIQDFYWGNEAGNFIYWPT